MALVVGPVTPIHLRRVGFKQVEARLRSADADATTDPIADTPMVVTLDQLRPYDLNPRVTRNPRYDEILASVRERGLDTSPAITPASSAGDSSIGETMVR